MLGARLSRVVFMVRGSEGVASAVNFYHQAMGLQVLRVTDDWAELLIGTTTSAADKGDSGRSGGGVEAATVVGAPLVLNLRAVDTEPQLSTGYTPMITFEVDDMDQTVASCAQAGGHLDGPIQYPAHGKVAALRAPDGHMIGLYEPTR